MKLNRNASTRLTLAVAFVCPALHAYEQSEIEEIIVTAPLRHQSAETVHAVSVVDEEELRRQLTGTLGGSLQQQPGINFASFGPGVGQPVLRGQGAPRVLVLQNSMPSEDAANTSGDHANAAEPVLAERIEVLRGPATLLFGGGAVGGVVNVLDGRVPSSLTESIEGALEYRGETNANTSAFAGRLTGASGNIGWHLSGFDRSSDETDIPGYAHTDAEPDEPKGKIENSDADASQFTAGLSWIGDSGWAGLAWSSLDNEYGIPPGAHAHEEEDGADEDSGEEEESVRIVLDQKRIDLQSGLDFDHTTFDQLKFLAAYTDYEHQELEGADVGTRYGVESWNTRTELTHSMLAGSAGAIGLQTRHRDFSVNGDEAFTPPVKTRAAGLFALQTLNALGLEWELGARFDHETHDPENNVETDFDAWTFSASTFHETGFGLLKAALSSSERAPTPEELYSDGLHVANQSYEIGDTSLSTEHSLNLDLGLLVRGERHEWQIETFMNRVSDFIYQADAGLVWDPELEQLFDTCPEDDPGHCLVARQWQAEDALFIGVETELTLQFTENLDTRLFADAVRAELDGGGNVPRLPPWRVGAALNFSSDRWFASLNLLHAADQDQPGAGDSSTSSYTRVGANLEYAINTGAATMTVFLRGENLLDQEIRSATSLLKELAPEAGRNIIAGIRLGF